MYFVAVKTDGQVNEDARRLAWRAGLPTVVVAAGCVVWTIVIAAGTGRPCVAVVTCGVVAAVPLIGVGHREHARPRGLGIPDGAVTIIVAVLTLWSALFPYVMPSSTDSGTA